MYGLWAWVSFVVGDRWRVRVVLPKRSDVLGWVIFCQNEHVCLAVLSHVWYMDIGQYCQ